MVSRPGGVWTLSSEQRVQTPGKGPGFLRRKKPRESEALDCEGLPEGHALSQGFWL